MRLFLLLPFLVCCFSCLDARVAAPNIIVLFADDMGYGDLASYGHPTIRTPHLDQMADEGLRLTSFYVGAAVCSPSRAALLTGRYPIHAGMPHNTGPGSERHLPLDQILIPQVLKQSGYRSMAVGKWHLGHQDESVMPTGRGFDHFFGLPYSNDMIKPWVQTDDPMYLYRDEAALEEPGHDQEYLTLRYTEAAISFIEASSGDRTPFFLYLAYSMPHLPVKTIPERVGRSPAGLYGDVIEMIDWSAGEILETLRKLGIDGHTLVIFSSDNGPWQDLPDRMLAGGNERWHSGLSGHLRGAKGTSYEGGPRVPAIFRWPGVIPAGAVSSEIVSSIDFFPTFANLAGAEIPVDHALDGFDLMPFLQGEAKSPRTEYLYSRAEFFEAIRVGPWKYRYAGSETGAELYHLDRDPSEMYNVVERYPEIVERLRGELEAAADQYGAVLRD